MKKKWAVAVTAVVSAASLGIAAPASAQSCAGVGTVPRLSTVVVENGQIRIDPNGVEYDVRDAGEIVENEAEDAEECALETIVNTVPAPAWCAYSSLVGLAWGGYVYQEWDTGAIVIDYARLVADADNGAACL